MWTAPWLTLIHRSVPCSGISRRGDPPPDVDRLVLVPRGWVERDEDVGDFAFEWDSSTELVTVDIDARRPQDTDHHAQAPRIARRGRDAAAVVRRGQEDGDDLKRADQQRRCEHACHDAKTRQCGGAQALQRERVPANGDRIERDEVDRDALRRDQALPGDLRPGLAFSGDLDEGCNCDQIL